MVSGAAMLLGTLGGGALGSIDLALPFVARSVLLALAFAMAWLVMHDTGLERRRLHLRTLPAELGLVALAGIRHGWSVRPVRWLYYLGFVQYAFLAWGFYAWQPYLLELIDRGDAIWVAGVVAAGLSLATIAGSIGATRSGWRGWWRPGSRSRRSPATRWWSCWRAPARGAPRC